MRPLYLDVGNRRKHTGGEWPAWAKNSNWRPFPSRVVFPGAVLGTYAVVRMYRG
jgi:hypothetical protein